MFIQPIVCQTYLLHNLLQNRAISAWNIAIYSSINFICNTQFWCWNIDSALHASSHKSADHLAKLLRTITNKNCDNHREVSTCFISRLSFPPLSTGIFTVTQYFHLCSSSGSTSQRTFSHLFNGNNDFPSLNARSRDDLFELTTFSNLPLTSHSTLRPSCFYNIPLTLARTGLEGIIGLTLHKYLWLH